MPPLSEVVERGAPRATGPALMSVPTAPSLSLFESTHLRQGLSLAASLVPRSGLHEHAGHTTRRASSSEDA